MAAAAAIGRRQVVSLTRVVCAGVVGEAEEPALALLAAARAARGAPEPALALAAPGDPLAVPDQICAQVHTTHSTTHR